ncbi:MAG: EAL domain-containing protein, partial [Janthinobacterium lividum]
LAGEMDWQALDRCVQDVEGHIETLVEVTAGDGFLYRQKALRTIDASLWLDALAVLAAVALSGLLTWLLTRRIVGPVRDAAAAAARIADGELETAIPQGRGDELGGLLSAMAVMRDNIRAMMESEVTQRRSAQSLLVDAVESTSEGVVLVDRHGRIVLANTQAAEFFPHAGALLRAGAPFASLVGPDLAPDLAPDPAAPGPAAPVPRPDPAGADLAATPDAYTGEWRLADGRWLRVSRSRTRAGGFVEIYSDITELRARAADLERINLQLDAALSNMSQGLCQYDRHGRLQVANTRYREMFRLPADAVVSGLSLREMIALNIAAGNHTRDLDDLFAEWTRFVAQRHEATMCHKLRDGRVISVSHQPTADGGWVSTFEDITDRRRAEAQIMFMARHDALTSLPNRILFGERVQQALAGARPPATPGGDDAAPGDGGAPRPFAVMHLDLDHFKSVNDAMGHPAGDRLLQQVAQRLLTCVGEADTVARLGGDEFAVVQRDLPGAGATEEAAAEAGRLAQRIVAALAEPFTLDSARISIGASVGIAVAPADGHDASALLKNADMALYRAKAEGRSTARFFEPSMDIQLQARRRLELDLRRAVEEEQFEVHYQPLVDLATGRVSGFEALLRWHHPTHGLVPPGDFIPIAEEVGSIVAIGEWVLHRACREAAAWPPEVSVAVNVSPAQFRTRHLAGVVAEALRHSGLAPGRLELEITESVLLRESETVLATLHQLRAAGVRIAMDDFGTGYSSLSYLRSFPFDKIKIDQSFVRDVARNADSLTIVRAAIGLGASLGMKVAAEGVETPEQVAILRAARCDQLQGFLYGRPAAAAAVPALLARLGYGQGSKVEAPPQTPPKAAPLERIP